MQYRVLGNTGLEVSAVCLGTTASSCLGRIGARPRDRFFA